MVVWTSYVNFNSGGYRRFHARFKKFFFFILNVMDYLSQR